MFRDREYYGEDLRKRLEREQEMYKRGANRFPDAPSVPEEWRNEVALNLLFDIRDLLIQLVGEKLNARN